jgi:hypothetical protein
MKEPYTSYASYLKKMCFGLMPHHLRAEVPKMWGIPRWGAQVDFWGSAYCLYENLF